MASSQGIPSLQELREFETPEQLFRALDFAEMDVHQQLTQLEAALDKVDGQKESKSDSCEEVVTVGDSGPSSDPIQVEEPESSDAMDRDTPSEMDTEKETDTATERSNETEDADRIIADEEEPAATAKPAEESSSATLFPDIIKNANFFTVMALLQVSAGRTVDAEQTIARSSTFPFLARFLAPVAKLVNDLGKDNFETAYTDLKTLVEKEKEKEKEGDLTVVWAAEQAFAGVQKLAHDMLLDCYKVVRVDAVKSLLHMEDLSQLQDQWEEFEQDGVSYLKRRDTVENAGFQLQLKDLVLITQELQQKGLYDEVK